MQANDKPLSHSTAMINEDDKDDYDLMLRDPTRPIPPFAYSAATIQDGVLIIMTMMTMMMTTMM